MQAFDELSRKSLRSVSARTVVIAALVLFATSIVLFYPGVMTWDSNVQYEQALTGVYLDWHPPVMARLWSYLLVTAPGGAAMFVLHTAAYWSAFALVALTLRDRLESV